MHTLRHPGVCQILTAVMYLYLCRFYKKFHGNCSDNVSSYLDAMNVGAALHWLEMRKFSTTKHLIKNSSYDIKSPCQFRDSDMNAMNHVQLVQNCRNTQLYTTVSEVKY